MVVGFPGQEAMLLARFLTLKPIIFDAFTSHYEGYILDRKYFSKNSLRSRYYRFLDRWSCRLADLVLLDTQAHINFFVEEFKLPLEKFRRIFIGTDAEDFIPSLCNYSRDKTKVLFFGTFIPLQGVEFILEAAKLLELDPIDFEIIGEGQEKNKALILARQLNLKNVVFTDMLAIDELRQKIAEADICLGIFGSTSKTQVVIPNKVYEAIALKKPVITADTPAVRELFDENDLRLIQTADPNAITEAIRDLRKDPIRAEQMAAKAYVKFNERASIITLGSELRKYILEKVKN
jgi:glycosyltransferase involved in cell wall biosynthesis